MLGGENMKTFEANVKSVSGAMKSGSSDVQGWALVQQDLNFQIAKFQQIGESSMIRLGQALLPMVTLAFSLLNNAMEGVSAAMNAIANNGSVKILEQGLGFLGSELHDLWTTMIGVAQRTQYLLLCK
jgi:hypothetical protein